MDSQVRLLPAVIGAAAVLALLRLGAMAMGGEGPGIASAAEPAPAAAAAAPSPQTPNGATPPTAATPAPAGTPAAAPAVAPGDAKPAAAPTDAGQPQSKGEADVLRGLTDRRGELDARENDLALREQLLAATQKQVDDKIAQLKAIQGKLDTMLAQRDDAQKAQLTALVKMYENMKPAEAAKIFDQLDKRILADVAGGMKPAKVGAILAVMETAKAQELTALLASRLILPEPAPALAAMASPPAPGVAPDAPAPSPAPVSAPTAPPTAPGG